MPGGKTFFWAGEYGDNLNSRETLDTELNVFDDVRAQALATRRATADVLFLANIQPDLQRDVREQCADARFVALDSMNLWIDIAHDSLVRTIRAVDCLILNDEELRAAHRASPNLIRGRARSCCAGARASIVAKQGKYGAALFTADGFFALPAYPLENVVDPTGAGDTFAGGFVGYVAAHPRRAERTHELLRRAMAYGTALASYNVEEFGTERVERLTADEVAARVADLQRMTAFSVDPVALRA